ncbi:hypothetical protein V494_07439, partial [Pseudogymnoascus sp. VKM F-4513 (FW-928)]
MLIRSGPPFNMSPQRPRLSTSQLHSQAKEGTAALANADTPFPDLKKQHTTSYHALIMSSADFQAAQQRIAARRAARAASAASQPQPPASSPLHKHLSHLPPSLNRLGAAGFTAWDTIRGRSGTNPAFRVGQADAELLDEELLSLLRGQITSGLKYFGDIQEEWG